MKTLLSLLFLLCACLPLQGRVGRILYYNKPANAPDRVYLYVDGQFHSEVDLPSFQFGQDIEFEQGRGVLKLIFSPRLLEEGEPLPEGLPSVNVRKGWEKFLIVVVESQKSSLLPIKPIVINANEKHFGNGDFLFMNLTPNLLGGTFGEEQIRVAPRKMHVAKMAAYQGEFLDVKLDYVRPDGQKKRRWMIYQGWRILPDRRTLVFCYVPEGRKTMKYFATQVKNM
ncbi:hypothetical protein QEH52_08420 [Coraliomargarita sp. SDUM461003]|uniref:DUF3108 domain-containing protein n=1 Tax=Thalassobacterium maritimum TaxID=3041265 RepID=A0ABU1AWL4_9BACT|nr:hypothetical protein [Coraliomargarita sp. SDUM461003]MDQ8207530.1 hypothetical protein [Coraliomargarita sp. SDUM461003]